MYQDKGFVTFSYLVKSALNIKKIDHTVGERTG